MKRLSFLPCLLALLVSANTANAVLVSATFDATFELDEGPIVPDGNAGIFDENGVEITLSYDSAFALTPTGSTVSSSTYTISPSALDISFAPSSGTAFTASKSGALTIEVVIDSAADSITFLNPGVWTFMILDETGTGLSSSLLPATSADLAAIGIPFSTTYSYVGLTLAGDEPSFVAINDLVAGTTAAIPEPSAFLFGGLVCSVLGVRGMSRKRLRS